MKCTSYATRLLHTLFLALLLVVGCNKSPQATPAADVDNPLALSATTAEVQSGGRIKALGTVRPARALQLSFGASGPIKTMLAHEGVVVQAGDLLAELDTAALQLELGSAQAQVAIQEAALDALRKGPSQADIARAEAEHAQQVAQATTALQVAQLDLEQARLSDPDASIALARAQQAQLELQLAQARAGSPQAEVTVAQVNLARAQSVLDAAQDEYRRALDRPWEPQEVRDALAKGIQQAEWEVEIAQSRLGAAQSARRAHELGLDLLAAQGATIEAQLAQALDAQAAYTVTLSLLAVRVEQAQQDLGALNAWANPLLDPPSPEAVAQAQARLRQAELAVEQVQWQMERAEIRAPFGGIISAVYLSSGEWATAGAPGVEILDTARWVVETRNVSELSIGKVRVGQEAEVQILALDNEVVRGQVDTISPVAVVQQGDTTYTLVIELESTDLNLRPGMNVQVEIQVG